MPSIAPTFVFLSLAGYALSSALTQRGPPASISNFYLVKTASTTCDNNSSNLLQVEPLTIFAPWHRDTFYLKAAEPGYKSLAVFSITNPREKANDSWGSLSTAATDGWGLGPPQVYSNRPLYKYYDLELARHGVGGAPGGGFSIHSGCMLAFNGTYHGWQMCESALGERTVSAFRTLAVDLRGMAWWRQGSELVLMLL